MIHHASLDSMPTPILLSDLKNLRRWSMSLSIPNQKKLQLLEECHERIKSRKRSKRSFFQNCHKISFFWMFSRD